MAIDYFTTGGGAYLVPAFNALAAFASSDLMESMARLAIVSGVLLSAVKLAFGGEFMETVKWFLVSMIVWLGFVDNRETVHINDSANPWLANRVVDNVPWAVAFFGGYVSEAGRVVSDRITALTSTPDALSYQRNGFLFGANLLSQATRFRVVDDKLAGTLNNFLEQCILYGTLLQHTDFEVVANSDDIAGVIPAELSNSMAFLSITESGGTVTTQTEECGAGYAAVLARVEADIDRVLLREAYGRYPSPEFTNAERIARYSDDLEAFQTTMLGASVSARDRIRQGMFITALDSSVERFLASTGNSAAMQSYVAAKAEAQSFASKNTAGLLAAKFVPLAKIVFEVLYITFFPIAVILMMTPYWPAVIKGYFGGFVWLASWEAVSVPLHNMALSSYARTYASKASFIDAGGTREAVISYANHLGVRSVEQDIASTAGYFMVFAPVLAAGMVFGASRLASVATSSISATQGAANETAREATAGSPSLNTPAMDNIRFNKLDTSTSVDTGRASGYLGSGALFTQNADGSFAFSSGSALTTGGVDFKYSTDMGQRTSERLEQLQMAAAESTNSFSEVLTTTARDQRDLMHNIAQNTSIGDNITMADGGSLTENARNLIGRAESLAHELGTDSQTVISMAAAANGGYQTPRGGVLSGGANTRLSATGSETASERFSQGMRVVEDSGFSEDYAQFLNAVETAAASQNQSHGVTSNMGATVSLDRVTTSASQVNNSFRDVETYARATEAFRSENVAATIQGNNAYLSGIDSNLRALGVSNEERIETLGRFAMGKGFLGDAEGMMATNMFVAESARQAGIPAIATGSGVFIGEPSGQDSRGFSQGAPARNGGDVPVAGGGRDEVRDRFLDESDQIHRRTSEYLPNEREIDGEFAARSEQSRQFQRGADSETGHAEATAIGERMLAEAIEEEANKSAFERAGDRFRRIFE